MEHSAREESQAGGAPAGYTTASTTSAPGQSAKTNGAGHQRGQAQAAEPESEGQWTESPENHAPQHPSTTTTTTTTAPHVANHPAATTKPKQHKHTVERPGKLHTRVPSYRGKQHHNAPPAKLVSRKSYHHFDESQPAYTTSRHTHRRAHSDFKLVADAPSANLKRNRSHQDVAKRDKLRAPLALTRSRSHAGSPADQSIPLELERSRGAGDEDGDDDEWVDDSANASINASPYPRTPHREPPPPQKHPRVAALSPVESGRTPSMSEADRDIAHHKEYLTSRLLRRAPSHNIPPQVSAAMAEAPRSHRNSPDTTISQDSTAPATPNVVSGGEEDEGLTSRFLTRPGSTFAREGSFFANGPAPAIAARSLDDSTLRRPRSMTDLASDEASHHRDASADNDNERRRNRRRAPPAEISRTQQKLNLQRASSVIEPQPLNPAPSMIGSAVTLVGMPATGYDGMSARDPRLPRLMEKTGMEYRVVRRYQNPLLRSISRLENVPGWDTQRGISRGGHARNSSLPPLPGSGTRPATPMRAQSSRGISKNGLVGGEALLSGDGDGGLAAALRNLWDKPLDLSASQ